MRIPLWLDLRHIPAKKRIPYLRVAKQHGCEHVLIAADDPEVDHEGALIVDGPRILQGDQEIGAFMPMDSAEHQQEAMQADGIVVIGQQDWTIIPLENLIAARMDRPGTVFAVADSPERAGVFRDTLDRGVHGVVLQPQRVADVDAAHAILEEKGVPEAATTDAFAVDLVAAQVTAIDDAGPGDRVCVDTTSILDPGEGLLVGSTARSFCLVHGETIETEFVRARPFRINAGAVHSYLMGPGGQTQYLSEVAAGSQVLAVSPQGTRSLTVGRAKIEHRPHFLLKWQSVSGPGSAILQNAETIRLVRPDGTPVSITALRVGDEILVHNETKARHFGMPVDERLEER